MVILESNAAGNHQKPPQDKPKHIDIMPSVKSNNPFKNELKSPNDNNTKQKYDESPHSNEATKQVESRLKEAYIIIEDLRKVNTDQSKMIDSLKRDKVRLEKDLDKERMNGDKYLKNSKQDNHQLQDAVKKLQHRINQYEGEIDRLTRENEDLYKRLKGGMAEGKGGNSSDESSVLREKVKKLQDTIRSLENDNDRLKEGGISITFRQ